MAIEEVIARQRLLDVVHPDMATLFRTDQAAFAMVRRGGLGASDAAVYMGVNPFTNVDQLVEEKKSIGYTDHEKEVAEKENVRKGMDLEHIILRKFSENMNIEVQKPAPMYRIVEHPQLTINFDGVVLMGEQPIPAEAKWVSQWANKYWDRSKCIKSLFEGTPKICGGSTIKEHIEEEAKAYGIPTYYYTQIQQQIFGLNAPFGYMAVLFDKGWEDGAYKIFRDDYLINAMVNESAVVWKRIKS